LNAGSTVSVGEMGRYGECAVHMGDETIYVPYVLPGEIVRISRAGNRGLAEEILSPSPARISPFCPEFTRCGGCSVQHWRIADYRAWKRSLVETALIHRGLSGPVSDLVDAQGNGRRRATLHVRRGASGMAAGFAIARSHDIHSIDACPILVPALSNAPGIAKAIGEIVGECDVGLTASDTGIDVVLSNLRPPPHRDALVKLANAAADLNLARISIGAELVVAKTQPILTVGKAKISLPPGVFLQATRAGEEELARQVLDASKGAKSVADLFCGVGPFTLRLAEQARVFAADSSAPAISALAQASRHTSGLKPVTVDVRDLFREPLMPRELETLDAVVLDPPRVGAVAQAKQLARSSVRTVISVSCDPASFARDAAILVKGGYRIDRVVPIDQFAWTGHVEIVGTFLR
jgi:23S rRNA (uracil1939-C5)-methyltransferase